MKTINEKQLREWDELIARYFEAETTAEEECRLRRFLVSEEEGNARYDEVRAVMGFIAVGRKMNTAASHPVRPRRRRLSIAFSTAAAAAVAAGLFFFLKPTNRLEDPFMAETTMTGDVCIAYIDGKKYTNPDIVMAQMHAELARTNRPDDVPTIESQLGSMFEGL